jgi:hypothetical protein
MLTERRIVMLADSAWIGRAGSGAVTAVAASPELEVLRFRIQAGEDELEALRHARRSMLREEWTLGRRDDEPSLEDATFSIDSIVWPIWPEQRTRCLEKIAELEARIERFAFGTSAKS